MENSNNIYYPTKYETRSQTFFNEYDFEKVITCPNERIRNLKQKSHRVCRFCNLKYGDVSFKKDAHIISNFLGNKHLVSDFECDSCNNIFSSYESHLANFIGPIRAFKKFFGEKENKKFKSLDTKSVTENITFLGLQDCVSVSRENIDDPIFEFDREAGKASIKLKKQPYSPLLVYKSILKIALSCLNQEDVKNYQFAFKYLLSDSFDEKVKGIQHLLVYTLPPDTGYEKPFACLFKKKLVNSEICTHVFALSFMNQVYQIVLPLHKNDFGFYNKEVNLLYSPPCFACKEIANSIHIDERFVDLSSPALVKADFERLKIQYDKDDYTNLGVLDLEKKEIGKGTEFNPNAIAKIIFLRKDAKFTFE